MKKLIGIVLLLTVIVSTAGCGKKEETAETGTNRDVKLETVVSAIKEAYGEDYLPNMQVEGEMIESTYGLTPDLYEEVWIEVPMISANIDTLVAVKTAGGKQQEVVAALNKYRDYLINDALQYPMNQLKLQASKVIEKDGFAFFVSLGVIPAELEKDEDIIKKAEELNQIAEDAINSILQ